MAHDRYYTFGYDVRLTLEQCTAAERFMQGRQIPVREIFSHEAGKIRILTEGPDTGRKRQEMFPDVDTGFKAYLKTLG